MLLPAFVHRLAEYIIVNKLVSQFISVPSQSWNSGADM